MNVILVSQPTEGWMMIGDNDNDDDDGGDDDDDGGDEDDDDDDDDDYHNDVPKRVPKRTEACFYFTISFVCPNHYVIVFGVQ